MKITYKHVLTGLLAVGLLGGCASKEVEYEGASSADANKTAVAETSVDNKMDQIAGLDEESVESEDMATDTQEDMQTTNSISAEDLLNSGINSVTSDINGQTVRLSSVHFAFDNYSLSTSMREIATQNASKIDMVASSYDSLKVKLEGNCDEWGTDEYNYALGLKRAKTAKDALVADGIDENRIILISFGESNPVCTDKTVACWKLNRRVDYRLLP